LLERRRAALIGDLRLDETTMSALMDPSFALRMCEAKNFPASLRRFVRPHGPNALPHRPT
jgi:hypothetical protein